MGLRSHDRRKYRLTKSALSNTYAWEILMPGQWFWNAPVWEYLDFKGPLMGENFKTIEEAENWLAEHIAGCIRLQGTNQEHFYYDGNGVRTDSRD